MYLVDTFTLPFAMRLQDCIIHILLSAIRSNYRARGKLLVLFLGGVVGQALIGVAQPSSSVGWEPLTREQLIERYAKNKVSAQKKSYTISFNPTDETNSEVIFNFNDKSLKPVQYFRFSSRQEYFQIYNQKFPVKDHHDASRFEFYHIPFKGRNYLCALGHVYGSINSGINLVTFNLFDITNPKQIRHYRNYSFEGQIENVCNIDNDSILDFIKIEKTHVANPKNYLPETVRVRDWFKVETYNFLNKPLWHKYRDIIYACDSKDSKYWPIKAEGSVPPTNAATGGVKKATPGPTSSTSNSNNPQEAALVSSDEEGEPSSVHATSAKVTPSSNLGASSSSSSKNLQPKAISTTSSPSLAAGPKQKPNPTKTAPNSVSPSKVSNVKNTNLLPPPGASMKIKNTIHKTSQSNKQKTSNSNSKKVPPSTIRSNTNDAKNVNSATSGGISRDKKSVGSSNNKFEKKQSPPHSKSKEEKKPEVRFNPPVDTLGFYVP
ncbi:MAG: hypothetical protein NZ576_05125 [Bacteroidia bacterium]|nr:hypothetical protein [Bacteroidia bacterium]